MQICIHTYTHIYVYRDVRTHNGSIQTIPQCETEMHLLHTGSILYTIYVLNGTADVPQEVQQNVAGS